MPNQKKHPKNTAGFTLIELLVVILVIGVLSGVLLGVVNSSGVRGKARDAQRKADIKKIQTALELYFVDHREYPTTAGPNNWEKVGSGAVINTELASYIDPIPDDPLSSGSNINPCITSNLHRYNYRSTGNTYNLTAMMEVPTSKNDSPCTDALVGCSLSTNAEICYFASNP